MPDLPRVTEILRGQGLVPEGPWYTEHALSRGTALHAAIALDDAGQLDEATVAREIAPRLAQYRQFRLEMGGRLVVVQSEVRVAHRLLGYCGTADALISLDTAQGVLDVKPSDEPWHGVQLAAYAMAADIPLHNRWNLVLTDDRYKLIRRTDRKDAGVFLSALSVYQWRVRHGLTAAAVRA